MDVVWRITAVFFFENKQIETRFYRFPKDHAIFIVIRFLNRPETKRKNRKLSFKIFVKTIYIFSLKY